MDCVKSAEYVRLKAIEESAFKKILELDMERVGTEEFEDVESAWRDAKWNVEQFMYKCLKSRGKLENVSIEEYEQGQL